MRGLNLAIKPEAGLRIAVETVDEIWQEGVALGASHFAEVEAGLDSRRRFKPSYRLNKGMEKHGNLLILAARIDGVLAGYFTWQITEDVESEGLLIGQQGAWYVAPQHAALHLGEKLFDRSIFELKARGVKCVFPHYRLAGRGRKLRAFFKRRGFTPMQVTLVGWIGD